MSLIAILIFFIVGTIPLLFAAVQPWVWSFYGLCMLLAFIIWLWQDRDRGAAGPGARFSNGYALGVALFFIIGFLACLPLPAAVLKLVSQTRYGILTAAGPLLESLPRWHAISYMPEKSLAWWVFLVSLGAFFITLKHRLADGATLRRLVLVIMGIGLVEAVYGLLQALVPSMGILWVDYIQSGMGNARGTFVNRNNFAAFMEMSWPLALGFTLARGGWRQGEPFRKMLASEQLNRQALLALGIVVMALALIFSGSRAGIFGAVVGFLTFLFLVRADLKKRGFFPWALLGAIVGLLILYSAAIGVGPVFERFLKLADDLSRLDIWRDSLKIVADHPLGIGLRNFENVFPIYNQRLITDKTVTYAHNDYLQLLIETGWPGFLALAGAFWVYLAKSVSRVRKIDVTDDPFRYFLACGALSGLVSVAFHGFFDFNLQIPANCVHFVVLLAILHACAWQPVRARRRTQKKRVTPQLAATPYHRRGKETRRRPKR
jgi:O-antigen ligase